MIFDTFDIRFTHAHNFSAENSILLFVELSNHKPVTDFIVLFEILPLHVYKYMYQTAHIK